MDSNTIAQNLRAERATVLAEMHTILAVAESRGELNNADRERHRELKDRLEDIDGRLEKIADGDSHDAAAASARSRADAYIRPSGHVGYRERKLSDEDAI